MKKLVHLSVFFVFAFFLTAEIATAQQRGNEQARVSPNATVSQTIGTTEVTVTYGRPGLKGRTYFAEESELAPVDKVWRTGANESTTITFSNNVDFGGEEVEAGTYALFTIPGKDSWTIILNKQLTRENGTPAWGAYGYDEAQDAVRVPTTTVDNEAPMMEWFGINFDTLSETKAHLNLHWGTTKVAVPISTVE